MKPLDPVEEAFRIIHRERCRSWRAANPEKSRASSKKWREKNPDFYRISNRGWKLFNREKHNAITQSWRERNPNYQREYRARKKAEREQGAQP